jgi:hypothetical protein
LESLSKQALLCFVTDVLLGEALSNKQPTANSPPKDLQLTEDLITGLLAGEISKNLLVLGNPFENQLINNLSKN